MEPKLQELVVTDHCAEGQGFALNYNPSYHDGGLLGHTGVDVSCGWGTPVAALADGYVYSTYPIEHPASDGYTAVFTIVETPLEVFEMSYGHVSEIDCQIGQQVKVGDIIAKEGNHGTVYSGNTLITLAMQAAGDHRGAHRHYQKRPVIKTQTLHGTALSTAEGTYRDELGNYYQVYDFENGFNGCVDWTQPLFPRDLFVGRSGYDVYLLQKAIVLEGCGSFDPTGYFGVLTLAGAIALQKKHGISPTLGYVGPLTRAYLNAAYHQLSA
jgi:peptidoglycan hydrolase-like protein with peptidoglycan-binding domain